MSDSNSRAPSLYRLHLFGNLEIKGKKYWKYAIRPKRTHRTSVVGYSERLSRIQGVDAHQGACLFVSRALLVFVNMLASLLGVRASGCSAGCNGPHKPADDATSPPTRTADRSPACARSEALCSSGGSRVPGGGSGLSVRFRTVGTSGNNSAPRRTIRLLTQNHHAVHAKFGTRGSVPWTHCGERHGALT